MQTPLTSAVSVHSVESVDFFPQGDFIDDQAWDLADKMAFSESPSDYTSVMISDQHLSFTHDRPENSEEQTLWATFTSTDSNASMGVPDGAYTWSTGPMISLSGFDTSGVEQYQLLSASLIVSFSIPDALVQDSVRFSIEFDSNFEIVREWSHTQSSTNYFNQPYWSASLFEHGISSWTEIQGMEVDLDYVGKDAGSGLPDDSQLQVDAVGVKVSFLTPWFGTERAEAISSVNSPNLPFLELNLSSGTMIELALGLSLHLGLQNDYNEIHPHIRYIEEGYMAGAYYNSVEDVSTYIGYRFEHEDFGLEIAGVTGYPEADVVPYVRATYKNVFIAPALEDDRAGIVIGYEFKLK